MEIVFILLTGTLMATAICSAFYIGYQKGKEHREAEGIKVDDSTKKLLKEYANFYTYDGNER